MEIVINDCYGGFGLSIKAVDMLRNIKNDNTISQYSFYADNRRTDKDLIDVIKKIGEHANGHSARLKIVKIPDDVDWYIDQYDGNEWVAEKHRRWS